MKFLLSIFFTLCASTLAIAETVHVSEHGIDIEATLQPTSFVVGDTVTLRIEASSLEGMTLSIPNTEYESFTELSSSDLLDIPDSGKRLWIWTKTFDTFNATVTSFPSIPIQWVSSTGKQGTINLNSIEVSVQSVAGDTLSEMELRDIKGMFPFSFSNWWAYLPIGFVLAAIAVLVVIKLNKTKVALSPPHELAMLALNNLDPKTSESHPFYMELSNIIRTYVENRFHIHASEQTTREFLQHAKQHPQLEHMDRKSLAQFLVAADLVKFARHEPSTLQGHGAVNQAKTFIEDTKPLELEVTS